MEKIMKCANCEYLKRETIPGFGTIWYCGNSESPNCHFPEINIEDCCEKWKKYGEEKDGH